MVFNIVAELKRVSRVTGPVSSVACAFFWYSDGHEFNPRVRQHSFVEIRHEIISTTFLSLTLIQVSQLSVTGE